MPRSTQFMMASVVAGLAGIFIAAGAAISHQAGPCEISVADGSPSRKRAVRLYGIRLICAQPRLTEINR